mmetsp:Transcript_22840/g.58124  ORF Transcript_22840/g.58124 Transcript_22840/m.58124 type:complete len:205 (-) Transcript_22840:72-686(-)
MCMPCIPPISSLFRLACCLSPLSLSLNSPSSSPSRILSIKWKEDAPSLKEGERTVDDRNPTPCMSDIVRRPRVGRRGCDEVKVSGLCWYAVAKLLSSLLSLLLLRFVRCPFSSSACSTSSSSSSLSVMLDIHLSLPLSHAPRFDSDIYDMTIPKKGETYRRKEVIWDASIPTVSTIACVDLYISNGMFSAPSPGFSIIVFTCSV